MSQPILVIPTDEGLPELRIHANPLYALYHFLSSQAQLPEGDRESSTAEAADLMAFARNPHGPQGIWNVWEEPLTSTDVMEEALAGLYGAMTGSFDAIACAVRAANGVWREHLWPERQRILDVALETIRERFGPQFQDMASRQAALLDLAWPDAVDAFLVTDCYAWQGGYSHPLTIDVVRNQGLELCETILHEATHVADVHGLRTGKRSLGGRLIEHLATHDVPPQAGWNVWHAVIFAASAWCVLNFIDASHVDYASVRGLYEWFKLPNLPESWARYARGDVDEPTFIEELASEYSASRDGRK